MRFNLALRSRVLMYARSRSSPNQTGVGTGSPDCRKLTSRQYLWPRSPSRSFAEPGLPEELGLREGTDCWAVVKASDVILATS